PRRGGGLVVRRAPALDARAAPRRAPRDRGLRPGRLLLLRRQREGQPRPLPARPPLHRRLRGRGRRGLPLRRERPLRPPLRQPDRQPPLHPHLLRPRLHHPPPHRLALLQPPGGHLRRHRLPPGQHHRRRLGEGRRGVAREPRRRAQGRLLGRTPPPPPRRRVRRPADARLAHREQLRERLRAGPPPPRDRLDRHRRPPRQLLLLRPLPPPRTPARSHPRLRRARARAGRLRPLLPAPHARLERGLLRLRRLDHRR